MNAAENKVAVTHKWIVSVGLPCSSDVLATSEHEFETKRKAQAYIRRLRAAWEVVYPDAKILLYEFSQVTETAEDGTILWETATTAAEPCQGCSAYPYHITEKNPKPVKKSS